MATTYTEKEAKIINKAIQDFKDEGCVISVFERFINKHTEPELDPCPFCGNKPTELMGRWEELWGCNEKTCPAFNADGATRDQWNTRV